MILTCRPTHTRVLPVAVLGQHAHENGDALNLFSVCNRFYLTWKYNLLVAWNLYCVLGSPKYAGSKCRRPSRAVGAVKLSVTVSRPSRLTMHVNYFNFWGYPSEINSLPVLSIITLPTLRNCDCIVFCNMFISQKYKTLSLVAVKKFSMMSSDTLWNTLYMKCINNYCPLVSVPIFMNEGALVTLVSSGWGGYLKQ